MRDELIKIMDELNEVRKVADDDLLFSKAVDIYLIQMQEANKDNRTQQIQKREEKKISFAQEKLLKRLGYKGNMNLSMKEASILISELKSKKEQDFDGAEY